MDILPYFITLFYIKTSKLKYSNSCKFIRCIYLHATLHTLLLGFFPHRQTPILPITRDEIYEEKKERKFVGSLEPTRELDANKRTATMHFSNLLNLANS